MSLFRRDANLTGVYGESIPARPNARVGSVRVTNDTALRHSAVWACLRLRADLVSTMPIDVFRKTPDLGKIEVTPPPVLVNPGGERVDITEWMYSSQVDLDRSGNAFGIITERTAFGLPARIDLVSLADVSVVVRDGVLDHYRIAGEKYAPRDVWHERQFTIAGLHVGLSPVAHAAWSIGEYLSAQQFALDWFGGGAVPSAHLRNTAKTLTPSESDKVKARYNATVGSGDVFVTGADWEYSPIQAKASETQWLEAKQASISDIARFFGCPSDLIDAAVRGQSVTYANIGERNLQFLIMHLGPCVFRRERALSTLVPTPRFVKINASSLLRMDAKARAEAFRVQIESRQLAPSEVRAIEDRQPFTTEQLEEFDRLFGAPRTQPQSTPTTGVTEA